MVHADDEEERSVSPIYAFVVAEFKKGTLVSQRIGHQCRRTSISAFSDHIAIFDDDYNDNYGRYPTAGKQDRGKTDPSKPYSRHSIPGSHCVLSIFE